jgi:hypothetical protein
MLEIAWKMSESCQTEQRRITLPFGEHPRYRLSSSEMSQTISIGTESPSLHDRGPGCPAFLS